jgi:SAM-dependent methyltransferase
MFFGTKELFTYIECAACGCLFISEIPTDLGRHYPNNYYSKTPRLGMRQPTWKCFLKQQRTLHWLGHHNPLGRVLARGKDGPVFIRMLQPFGIGLADRILDVGCGSGSLLIDLASSGFTKLTGADPFIDKDISYDNGVRIYKRDVSDLEPPFDLIMFNHSFEHLDDPRGALRHTRRLLADGGRVLIRVPVADSFAWRRYGVNWVQLDAPRHLMIHTRKSVELLATEAGLALLKINDDSEEFQFWASEAYERDVPLIDAVREQHTPESRAKWRARAAELNSQGEGDQACFYFAVR